MSVSMSSGAVSGLTATTNPSLTTLALGSGLASFSLFGPFSRLPARCDVMTTHVEHSAKYGAKRSEFCVLHGCSAGR